MYSCERNVILPHLKQSIVSIPSFGYWVLEDCGTAATLATGVGAVGPTLVSLAVCATGCRSFPLNETPGVVRDLNADFNGGDTEVLGFTGLSAKNLAVPVRAIAAAMSWGWVMVVKVCRAESMVCIRLLCILTKASAFLTMVEVSKLPYAINFS